MEKLKRFLVEFWRWLTGADKQWRLDLERCVAVGGTVGRVLAGEKLIPSGAPGKPRAATRPELEMLVGRRLAMLRQVAKIPGARFVPLAGRLTSKKRQAKKAVMRNHGLSARQLRRERRRIRPQVAAMLAAVRQDDDALERGLLPKAA